MSASGEDTINLNQEGESPAATLSEGIPVNTTDVGSCGLKDVEQKPLTSDDLEEPLEVEAVIEKKLPSDKGKLEKALDVDSELDFELKWDDDTDLNEDQDNDDIDLDSVDNDLDSDLTSIEKDLDSAEKEIEHVKVKDTDSLDQEIDSAFTSTVKDLDSLHKETGSHDTSVVKDLYIAEKEMESVKAKDSNSLVEEIDSAFTSIEQDLDSLHKETGSHVTSVVKDLDSAEKEMESVKAKASDSLVQEIDSAFMSMEKDLDSLHKETGSHDTSVVKDLDSAEKEIESVKVKDTDSLDQEIDTAFMSIEKDLDSLHKDTGSHVTSIEKELDSIDKEMDSALTSAEKDLVNLDQEIESDLASIEKDVDSLDETDITFTCPEKDVGNQEKEIVSDFTPLERDLDSINKKTDSVFPPAEKEIECTVPEKNLELVTKDIQHAITSLEKDIVLSTEHDSIDKADITTPVDNLDNEFEDVTSEKDLDSVNNGIQNAITSLGKDNAGDEIDGKIVSNSGLKMDLENDMDSDVYEETHAKAADNDSEIGPEDTNDGLKKEKTLEDKAIKVETGAKTNTGIESSPIESETNSLDEELVYSDPEALDIEDKELMDEIDAEIAAEINKDKLESPDVPQVSSEQLSVQKESEDKTTEKDTSDMDVDVDLPNSSNLAISDLNTSSSVTDLETSMYDINNEHGLDKPDVMIDIPTEELIDSFDDIEDISEDDNKKLDQSQTEIMDKPNIAETKTKEDHKDSTETQAIQDEINLEKNHVPVKINEVNTAFDMLLTDELDKSAGGTVQIESMEIDTHDVCKEIDKPDVIDISEINTNVETHKHDQENASKLEEKVSHADIILEATAEQPGDVSSASEVVSELTKEVEIPVPNLKEVENTTIASYIEETDPPTSNKDVESIDNSKLKINTLDSHVEPQQTTSSKLDKDVEVSDKSKLKEDTALDSHIDIAQPSTSTTEVKDDESPDNIKINNVDTQETQADEAQPSTSTQDVKDLEPSVKLKIEDVETQETHVDKDKAQPSTSTKEIIDDSSDKSKLKDVDTDEAQQTTSNHSELSDEDQEATDSLGLLAESSRVMDDDDEQDQEAEPDDDDDDDDFDQDDESNQMTADHSEDSNAQQSEADVPKEAMDVDESNDAHEQDIEDTPDIDEAGDENDEKESNDEKDSNDEKESTDDKEESNDEKVESNDEKDESNDEKDESNDERDDFQIQIGEVVSQTEVEAAVMPEKSVEPTEETETAVEAIPEDKKEESTEVPPVAATTEDEAVKPTESESDTAATSKLRQILLGQSKDTPPLISDGEKISPTKTMKLEIAKPKNEINIVELEESSSEDDIQIVQKCKKPASPKDVTSVNIPAEVEVMSAAAGATTELRQEAGELVISGLPKPAPHKPARLNTDEVSIKTAPAATLNIPETKAPKSDSKASIDFGLEIYSLDSDDEETEVRSKRKGKLTAVELDKARQTNKCINMQCTSDGSVPLVPASLSAAVYYAATQQRGGGLCLYCAKRFEERSEKLIEGVKDQTPFLSMDMCMIREEFVEISDSDSEDEPEVSKDDEIIGEKGAKFLEEHLADVFNGAWKKFNMEERLLAAQAEINVEVELLEEECKQIDAMLNECQKETDKLRNDLYTRFADDRRELPAITICDTPSNQWSGLEEALTTPSVTEIREQPPRSQKRRLPAPAPEPAAKRAAIPLGYKPLAEPDQKESKPGPSAEVAAPNDDDNADISVVKLSVESAPAGLPPPGVATRPPLRPNMLVFAMRNSFGAWHKVRIIEVQPKLAAQFTMCRVRFEQPKTMTKLLPARCLAYEHPPDVRLTIGTRVVALFKDHRVNVEKKEEVEKKEAYYSGIVAEIPNPVNNYRYLIFFDDGYAQYVQHAVTRLVCECAPRVWDEVHPFSRQFVRDYLRAYPERPMVRLHAGQSIKTEWDGKWWVSKVLQVDASLVLVYFEGKKDNKTEWIYRGSTRLAPLYLELQAAERTRARPLPRAQAARRYNMPYVEYTRSDEAAEKVPLPPATPVQSPQQTQAQIEQEIRRQRAVAKKSTAPVPAPPPPAPRDAVTSRVVFYTPKNAIRPHKMVPHTCGPKCKRTDVLALKDLRTYNPLTKPLLSGWERQQVRYRIPAVKAIMYRAPCGRRIRDYRELHRYLQAIDSDMGVDLFDFNPATHCLAEFLLNKCLISKKDLSHGKENVPVPCVNYYDSALPEFCSYNTERTPTAGVPLNLDPDFLCGCDCTDDCADKSKCACWKMTLEGARTIGLDTSEVGYVYKRLPEPLPSGIYECNVRCKCKQTCLNRVAQHPLQLKLQVFKTANRGWGIRALNDVPKGAFLCVYAGNLLTDATANLDGLNEGDEYLAELDYIEVVEQMKEGFEEDIPEDAKKLDEEESDSSTMSSSDEERNRDGDDDFRPAMPRQYAPSEYSKRLRKREKSKKAKEKEEKERKEREEKAKDGEDCITISDDEELREPAHFSVQTGMKGKEFVSKYKSVRTLFGKDEACYIMDAKVQGNIGRYLNHSCTPNVFVQNVFVDTHDPRFPWVAFFALSQIRAGTELTWNYNYDVGSVPGKVLYCYCNAPNCRGRLL